MFCLLYSPKQKIVKFHAQKQTGKSHPIDIFTSEDMENISLCIFQYLTLYYIIKVDKQNYKISASNSISFSIFFQRKHANFSAAITELSISEVSIS
jgi:hypothetical protein